MSDAKPRSSCEAPASADGNGSDSSTGYDDFDMSLIHDQTSITKEEASGGGEGKADSKQRRKRTSPKDQATLEAEYKLNPKPNKAARAEIVEKVDLNEKEVQIWFQNRRQIQRRKSRPLLPHEIAAFGIGGLASLSSDPASASIFSSSQSTEEPVTSLQEEMITNAEKDSANSQEFPEPSKTQQVVERVEDRKLEPAMVMESTTSTLPPPIPSLKREPSAGISGTEGSSFYIESVSKSFSSTPGYLANRWNAANSSFSTPASSQQAQFITPTITNPINPSSCPERIGSSGTSPPSSGVRLSMSLDGKAELISSEQSPPRVQAPRPSSSGSVIPQRRTRGLRRSQSAYSFGPITGVSPLIPGLPRGRSRDARTWQLACDPEARDELTTQAENESSGSAVAAISLLRSTSRSALQTNSNKRNAPSVKQDFGAHVKKSKLGRAQSSLARLQSTAKDSSSQSSKGKDGLMRSPSGDSDKENWAPHEDGSNARRRLLPSGRPDKQFSAKPVLGDNFNPPTQSANIGIGRNKRRKGANVAPKIFEDQENNGEVDVEVEKFMYGEVSPSKRGEFEGAQALLAMMGSWR